MIFGDLVGLSFPDICLMVEEKPQKKPQPGNLTWLGIEPGPTRWDATMLPFNHGGGLREKNTSYIIVMSILPKGRSFTANSGTKVAVLLNGRSSTANSGTQAAVLLGIDRWGSFLLLSTPHSLFSIWTDLKRSEKIPGAPTQRWGEWIWLTVPSGLHQNLPQELNIGSRNPN